MKNESKAKKKRSSAYPYVDLEQAIELMDKLTKSTGKGPYSREAASVGMGHTTVSGPSAMKISALVHFGLLSRAGNVYSRTNLAERVQIPTSEEDRKNAINELVMHPKLYKVLIEKYSNQTLPTLLVNILVREHGINENVSKNVAKNFKKSVEFTGLMVNGVLGSKLLQEKSSFGDQKTNEKIYESERITKMDIPSEDYPIDLRGGLIVIFPKKYMRDVIKGEFKEGVNKLEEKVGLLEKNRNENSKKNTGQ